MPHLWQRPLATPLFVPNEALAAGPWETIGASRLSAAAASVSFASIPAQYVMFRLRCEIIKDGTAGQTLIRFNNDSGANYDKQYLISNDTVLASARNTGDTSCVVLLSPAANQLSLLDVVVAKPIAGSRGLALVSQVTDDGALRTSNTAFIWNNTADLINRIDIVSGTTNFAANSLFILQGSRW